MNGLRPLAGITSEAKNVGPMWLQPIFGSDDDDESKASTNDGVEPKDDKNPKGGENANEDDDEKTDFSGIDDPRERRIAELSDESAKRRRALRDYKKETAGTIKSLEDKIKALEKANDPDANKISDDDRLAIEQPHLAKIEKMTSTMRDQAIRSAILAEGQEDGAKRRVWHSVQNVVSQINADAIDFDAESGIIEGVSDELNRIASEQPFLVKEKGKAKSSKDDDEEDKGGSSKRGASGRQPGGAGTKAVHGMDPQREKELKNRFPILGRH